MGDHEYQGWENRETWTVALHIDNDRGCLGYWLDHAADHRRRAKMFPHETWSHDEDEKFGLEDDLKDKFSPLAQEPDLELARTLIQCALDNVNWREIAEHLLRKLDEGVIV